MDERIPAIPERRDILAAHEYLQRTLPIALLQARDATAARLRTVLGARMLTEQQWRVLFVLSEDGPLDCAELSRRAFILPPSLTRIVRTLEERGYLDRNRDPLDGRRITIEITPATLALIEELGPQAGSIYGDILERFGVERMELLIGLLLDLASMADSEPKASAEA